MKLIRWAMILLFSGSVVGQVAPAHLAPSHQPGAAAETASAKAQKPAMTDIPANAAVISVPGLCKPSAKAHDCKIVVTRAQFEALVGALPEGRAQGREREMRGRLASQYGEMLAFATEAEKLGLEKDADTQAMLRFARTQVLARQAVRAMQQKAQPSPEKIQQYYDDNKTKYEAVSVQRVVVPIGHAADQNPADKQTLKVLAEETRKRLVAGEDAEKLEQEVYTKLGFKKPPETAMLLRPTMLAPEQQSVATLKAGEISELFSEQMGFIMYKSEGTKLLPLDSVKDEIKGLLEQQKMKAAIEAIKSQRKAVLNEAYFGPVEVSKAPHQ